MSVPLGAGGPASTILPVFRRPTIRTIFSPGVAAALPISSYFPCWIIPPVVGPCPSAGSRLIEPSSRGCLSTSTAPRTMTLPSPQPGMRASRSTISTPMVASLKRKSDIVFPSKLAERLAALRRRERSPCRQRDIIGDKADAAVAQQNHHAARMQAPCGERDPLRIPTGRSRHAWRSQDRKAHSLPKFIRHGAVGCLVGLIERTFGIVHHAAPIVAGTFQQFR